MTDRRNEIKKAISYGLDWDDRARKYYVDVTFLLTELERLEAELKRVTKFHSSDAQDLNNGIVSELSALFNLEPGQQAELCTIVPRYKQAAEMLRETMLEVYRANPSNIFKTLKETAWMEETP